MKRKWLPPFFMLFAGAVVSIVMFRMRFDLKKMLLILFAVLLIFYAAGSALKWMLDCFDRQNEEKAAQEKKNGTEDVEDGKEHEEGQVNQEEP